MRCRQGSTDCEGAGQGQAGQLEGGALPPAPPAPAPTRSPQQQHPPASVHAAPTNPSTHIAQHPPTHPPACPSPASVPSALPRTPSEHPAAPPASPGSPQTGWSCSQTPAPAEESRQAGGGGVNAQVGAWQGWAQWAHGAPCPSPLLPPSSAAAGRAAAKPRCCHLRSLLGVMLGCGCGCAHPLPLLLQLLDGGHRLLLLIQADALVLDAVVQPRQLAVQLSLALRQQVAAGEGRGAGRQGGGVV